MYLVVTGNNRLYIYQILGCLRNRVLNRGSCF